MSSTGSTGTQMVDTATAADLLGHSVWTITRWCRIGRLPGARQPGHLWQIPLDAVHALLAPHHPATETES
jgi:excisionase family DNA binding protein